MEDNMEDNTPDDFKKLIGKKILSIEWDENGIRFNMQGDAIYYKAHGDCCSSSYIESLDNPEIFKDAEMLSVESVDGGQKELGEFEWHKWNFYKFKTTKGMCTLSFRNESNGYYDGWLTSNPFYLN